jgi:hypothetical protein
MREEKDLDSTEELDRRSPGPLKGGESEDDSGEGVLTSVGEGS